MTHNIKAKQAAPATPLPWHVGLRQAQQIIYDDKGWAVANATVYHGRADGAETRANATYIVEACNAYPRLMAEREQLVAALRNCVNAQDVTGGPKGSTELACTEGARYLLRQIEGAE